VTDLRWLLRALALLAAAVVIAVIVLDQVPSGDYLFLPDTAHPVAPLVTVQGAKPAKGSGGIYFVDVLEDQANELESLFPWLRGGGVSVVPRNEVVPPGVSNQAARQADFEEMHVSQQVAAAVALRTAGYKVSARPDGVTVSTLIQGSNAAKVLNPDDVIVAVNGVGTPTVSKLRAQLSGLKIGDVVKLVVRRASRKVDVSVRTIADPLDRKRAIVGFTPDQSAHIVLPLHVSIDAGNVGGPSAGLAFALQVLEELGRNVDHGYRIAATGEMELDGTVAPIGGVEQKTYGARKAHADLFLVPAGDNATEARRYAHGLRIVAVKSFPQALRILATLPPKR
jgi:PDZ domain-containing protein